MDAEELLVHQGGQRKAVERLHASIVDALRILNFTYITLRLSILYNNLYFLKIHTFLFEGKVLGQMPAFVVAPQQVQGGRVANFQCPQVEDALQQQQGVKKNRLGVTSIRRSCVRNKINGTDAMRFWRRKVKTLFTSMLKYPRST